MKSLRAFSMVFILLAAALQGSAQSPGNVLVIENDASPASIEIGEYYAQRRNVPRDNVIRIRTAVTDGIERADYERQIEMPVAGWIARNSAQDRILYIVLTKGIPLRVNGPSGQDGTVASVDSELTLLYRKMSGQAVQTAGRVNNPYFLGETQVSQAKPFTHENFDIYLVSRLDGYSTTDVRALIDRGSAPAREGIVVLDDRASAPNAANEQLKSAADKLRASIGIGRVIYDTSATVIKDSKGVLGYYSWGSNDPAIRDRHFNLSFANGALAAMFVSTDARTFNEPPSDWRIGRQDDPTTHYSGSPQSLLGDFIRDGITGGAGHVTEPFLDATIRSNILFPAYFGGANLIESFYQAMPYLSWQTVVVGDPLCAPFRTVQVTAAQIDRGIDPATELPAYFSGLRLRHMSTQQTNPDGVPADTLKILMRADVRAAKQDFPGMQKALEEATAKDARLGPANLTLGMLYDQNGEYDKAIERYRKVLALAPDNVLALNNLAYTLAVRRKALDEALPLAEKAYGLVNNNPGITDTLAWILHLGGKDGRARGLLLEAVQGAPQAATIRLHAAVVHAALNETEAAQQQLSRALELDPKLASSEEVQHLRARLKLP